MNNLEKLQLQARRGRLSAKISELESEIERLTSENRRLNGLLEANALNSKPVNRVDVK